MLILIPKKQEQLKRPAPESTAKQFSAHQQISNLVSSYNLDDPEELEKWKAERRKKFPKIEKDSSEFNTKEAEVNVQLISKSSFDVEEEGALNQEEINNSNDDNNYDNTNSNNIDNDDNNNNIIIDNNIYNNIDDNVRLKTKKRFCKYFAKGKCNKGDYCPFEHVNSPKPLKTTFSNNRPTVFENLLKIEENESMLRFYECIKYLVNNFNKSS